MTQKVDLHLHTTASDGMLSPEDLVRRAAQQGFAALAITDHDTLEGVERAQRAGLAHGVEVIPGVELSARCDREVHVLGYGMRLTGALTERMRDMRQERAERVLYMVEKLRALGMEIAPEEVRALAAGAIGRVHVAQALMQRGYVGSVAEAFARYLGEGRPAYVPREKLGVGEAIALIRAQGGLAVLAHPGLMHMEEQTLFALVRAWKAEGLAGIEVYHSDHDDADCAFFRRMAEREGLLITGGSDFHGTLGNREGLGAGLELWHSMERDFCEFFHRLHPTNERRCDILKIEPTM